MSQYLNGSCYCKMCFCYEPVKLVFADHLLELQVFAEKESESSQESDLLNSIFSQMLSSLLIILCYDVLVFPISLKERCEKVDKVP